MSCCIATGNFAEIACHVNDYFRAYVHFTDSRSCLEANKNKSESRLASRMATAIDHIVIGLPYSDLQNPPEWLTRNFTIKPGGRHKDGKTENKLIVFRDGSCIELIAFVEDDPVKRKGHYWGDHKFGYYDWALTSSDPRDIEKVNQRIKDADTGMDACYGEQREGAAKFPDGTEIKWATTLPEHVRRGELPFWCHDITARELRVPDDEVSTTHPCGAVGIGELKMLVPTEKAQAFKKIYTAVLGVDVTEHAGITFWNIHPPIPCVGWIWPSVVLGTPALPFEEAKVKENHAIISEVCLLTETVGLGQSRDAIIETIGGEEFSISFMHAAQL